MKWRQYFQIHCSFSDFISEIIDVLIVNINKNESSKRMYAHNLCNELHGIWRGDDPRGGESSRHGCRAVDFLEEIVSNDRDLNTEGIRPHLMTVDIYAIMF